MRRLEEEQVSGGLGIQTGRNFGLRSHLAQVVEDPWQGQIFGVIEHHSLFSYHPDIPEPYKAARKDGKGTLEAKDPETLRTAVQQDYIACKVPREIAP